MASRKPKRRKVKVDRDQVQLDAVHYVSMILCRALWQHVSCTVRSHIDQITAIELLILSEHVQVSSESSS